MSVKMRPYRRGGWEVDIRIQMDDGTEIRRRWKSPVPSKSGARRWGQARERELLANGPPRPSKEVPTLAHFAPRYMDGHVRANRLKPSTQAAQDSILRVHLIPTLGQRRLDAIGNEDVQRLKQRLSTRAVKTVNNVLSVLSRLLKCAVEWDVIDTMPCQVRLLTVAQTEAAFHDFEEFERLVGAAGYDSRARAIVLLGGEAGLRCGEMMALEWNDVDFSRGRLQVARSDWRGHVTAPKSGRPRTVPMTARLQEALRKLRHLRGPRVVCEADGSPLTQKVVQNLVRGAARRAHLANEGVHVLRHTFCSHLSMRGAPVRAIQELAGHSNLSTTQRYMHLSPAALKDAIALLEGPKKAPRFGDIVETG